MSQLGSSPTSSPPGSGYFNVTQYRDLLTYSRRRHIDVIPEFDMPGHAHAAVAAMKARHRVTGDTTYLLSDFGDRSQYKFVASL